MNTISSNRVFFKKYLIQIIDYPSRISHSSGRWVFFYNLIQAQVFTLCSFYLLVWNSLKSYSKVANYFFFLLKNVTDSLLTASLYSSSSNFEINSAFCLLSKITEIRFRAISKGSTWPTVL